MKKRTRVKNENGSALFGVMILTLVMSSLIGLMVVNLTGQNSFNRRGWKHEKSMVYAESGVQRAMTALAHNNDGMSWDYKDLTAAPASAPDSFWLWQWHSIKDEKGKDVGRYRLEVISNNSKRKLMRLKASGLAYDRYENGKAFGAVQRAFGVELKQLTLGDFAIATNHQLGGARINGGARIYGGLLTAGEVHLDASSTGIYNDYLDLQSNQNFANYSVPEETPDAEVFVYKDPSLPENSNNGVIKLAAQASLGSSDKPMQGIHTAETSAQLDPGDGSPGTEGDGIIGNGEDRAKGPRDHKLPEIQFPDASSGSGFMTNREADAQSNGNAVYEGDLELGETSFSIGDGPALSYDASTGVLTINGPVFIKGNVKTNREIRYSGQGGLFIDGNFSSQQGIEPIDPTQFPDNHALGIVASNTMELGQKSGNSSRYAGFFFGNQTMKIEKAKIFGNLFGGTIQLPQTGTRPDIYVHPEVMGSTGVTLPDFIKAEIVKNMWWEMNGNEAQT